MIKSNNEGLWFAITANDNDSGLPKGRGDCFDYGSMFGCSVTCPVFVEGECKIEDKKAFLEMIKDEAPEDLDDFLKLYPKLLGE